MSPFDSHNIVFLTSLAFGVLFALIMVIGGTESDPDSTSVDRALSLLGVGRMPIVLLLTVLTLSFVKSFLKISALVKQVLDQ